MEWVGVDLRWWGWLPVTFLCAAVIGFAVNWLRDLLNGDAIPTLAADLLIGVLVLASTTAIFGPAADRSRLSTPNARIWPRG